MLSSYGIGPVKPASLSFDIIKYGGGPIVK